MPIDWFTVIAQAINFFVLLWLLKRFLYHPIIDALDAREKKIAGILANADEKKANAEKLQNDYEKKLANIEQQRQQTLASAQADAQRSAKAILANAQRDADQLQQKRKEALETEIAILQQEVLKNTVQEIYAVCKTVLHELADCDVHERMYSKFIQRLNGLDTHEREALNNALIASNNTVVVHSSFQLTNEQLSQLTECISNKRTTSDGSSVVLTGRTKPELIAGFELVVSGWKISWTISHYLTALRQKNEEAVSVSPVTAHSSFAAQPTSNTEATK